MLATKACTGFVNICWLKVKGKVLSRNDNQESRLTILQQDKLKNYHVKEKTNSYKYMISLCIHGICSHRFS